MSRLFSLAAFCALSVTSLDPAWADSCQSLDITGFSEGDVVYRERPNQAWKEVTNIASLSGSLRRSARFYYVAQGQPNQPGILVIKTARLPKPSMDGGAASYATNKSVRLERKRTIGGTGNNNCVVEGSPPINREVAGSTYDGYHDYGFNSGDGIQLIKRFHIGYLNRDGNCDHTDNPYGDSFWTTRNSNRSQFSFDKQVVNEGMYYKVSGFFPSAYAAENLYDRHVIMEPYTISADRTACVPFYLKIRPDSILRIVDLEARQSGRRLLERER